MSQTDGMDLANRVGGVGFLLGLVPPRAALRLSVGLLLPLVVVSAAVWWLTGPVVTLAFLLGVVAGVPAATAAVGPGTRVATAGLCALAGVAGLETSSSPVACGLVVTALALAQGPLAVRAGAIGMFAPVIAAVFASIGVSGGSVATAVSIGSGFALIQVLARLLRVPRAASPVSRSVALRHTVTFALLAGPAVAIPRALEVGHGYWLVLTLAAVLRPAPQETRRLARARWSGTVAGVAAAIVAALVLPGPLVLVTALVCAAFTLAWGVAGDVGRQTMFATAIVFLLGSGGSLRAGVEIGVLRLGLTAAAVVLATAAAEALLRAQDMRPTPRGGR